MSLRPIRLGPSSKNSHNKGLKVTTGKEPQKPRKDTIAVNVEQFQNNSDSLVGANGFVSSNAQEMSKWSEELKELKKRLVEIPLPRSNDQNIAAEEIQARIRCIEETQNKMEDMLFCMSTIMKENVEDDKAYETDDEIPTADVKNLLQLSTDTDKQDTLNSDEQVVVDLSESIRKKSNKKKRKLDDVNDKTVIRVCSMTKFVKTQKMDPISEQDIRIRNMMNVKPTAKKVEMETCPVCPNSVILEELDSPPSLVCFECGFTKTAFCTTEEASYSLGYRSKQHFMVTVNRIRVKVNYNIPNHIYDSIYTELSNRGVTNLNDVSVGLIDDILHKLSKHKDKCFTHYYQHKFQITNKIRGAPIVVLSNEQINTLDQMFDMTHDAWELIKPSSRLNFLTNSFVIRMFFYNLGFPMKIVNMLSTIKCDGNIRSYNAICEKICKTYGWKYKPVSEIQDSRKGVGGDIGAQMLAMNKNTKARSQPSSATAFPSKTKAVTKTSKNLKVTSSAPEMTSKNLFPAWSNN